MRICSGAFSGVGVFIVRQHMTRLTKQIQLTPEQVRDLSELLRTVETGGAVIAQVYRDGLIACVLSPQDAKQVNSVLRRDDDVKEDIFASSLAERNKQKESIE